MFETTLLGALWPERVDVSRLPREPRKIGAMILGRRKAPPNASGCGVSSARIHATTMPQRDLPLLSACVNWIVVDLDRVLPR